jgi:hypothetical protein
MESWAGDSAEMAREARAPSPIIATSSPSKMQQYRRFKHWSSTGWLASIHNKEEACQETTGSKEAKAKNVMVEQGTRSLSLSSLSLSLSVVRNGVANIEKSDLACLSLGWRQSVWGRTMHETHSSQMLGSHPACRQGTSYASDVWDSSHHPIYIKEYHTGSTY